MPAESSDSVELKLESRDEGGEARPLLLCCEAGDTGCRDGLMPRLGVDVTGVGNTAPVVCMKEQN